MQVTPTASCGGTCSPPSRCSWRSSCQLSPYYCYCPELVWELLPSLELPQLQPEHGEGSWLRIGEPSEPRREHRSPWLRGEAWPEHLPLGVQETAASAWPRCSLSLSLETPRWCWTSSGTAAHTPGCAGTPLAASLHCSSQHPASCPPPWLQPGHCAGLAWGTCCGWGWRSLS